MGLLLLTTATVISNNNVHIPSNEHGFGSVEFRMYSVYLRGGAKNFQLSTAAKKI